MTVRKSANFSLFLGLINIIVAHMIVYETEAPDAIRIIRVREG